MGNMRSPPPRFFLSRIEAAIAQWTLDNGARPTALLLTTPMLQDWLRRCRVNPVYKVTRDSNGRETKERLPYSIAGVPIRVDDTVNAPTLE